MIKRLRIKFVCINMAIVTAMLLVIFGMVFHFTRENLEKQSIGMMQTVMDDRLPPIRPGEAPEEIRLPWFRVSRDLWGKDVVFGYYDLSDEETVRNIIRTARESDRQTGILPEYNLRYAKAPGMNGERIVFVDISSEFAALESLVKTCIMVGVLSLAVFFLLSLLLARWAIRPVEEAWNRQRQFVADASHELKTPLTVIMTNAELLQDSSYDVSAKEGFSESILTMSRQMRFLVERLLDLARGDNGTAKMEFQPLDLGELVADSLLPFEPVYFERQLQLESEVEPGLQIRGSESHLKQMVEILLDNGAKYTSEEGTVWVRLRRCGNNALLSVAGPGEQIGKEDLRNIFRRFYRVDQARSRDGSYGLGLSIAESIVSEHGGRIWAESNGGINTFFVQMPLL